MTAFRSGIPLNISGPSFQDRSRPLTSQETKNFYPEVVEEGKDQFVIKPFYGLDPLASVAGLDRGMAKKLGFRVVGTKLYSFDSSGAHTELGNIPGFKRCIFAYDGENLVIVAEKVWIYNPTGTPVIQEVTDVNIVGATAATFINNQIVYTVNGLFVVANVGDPKAANGLNAAGAESQPDALVRAYAFQQNVYMFGESSTEPYWNSGVGNPPFERIDGQIFEVGCAAIYSIDSSDDFIYWLGDDNAIYRASGGQRQKISTPAISNAIEQYSKIDDAIGFTFSIQGQNFYCLTFPTANKTWVLNEGLGNKGWFNLSSGLSDDKWQATSLSFFGGKNFLADASNGQLYELSRDVYTYNGDTVQRRRITNSINSDIFGVKGQEMQGSRVRFIMETGVGLLSGQGEDPRIQFEVSFDGGRSWKPKGWGRIGRLGEYTLTVDMDMSEVFYDMIIRITCTDPVPVSIYSASGKFRLTGRK